MKTSPTKPAPSSAPEPTPAAGANPLLAVLESLAKKTARLRFGEPVAHVYHPLEYAWPVTEAYFTTFGACPKEVVLVGMNPGPFGMTQTGVPFGEVAAVRDWMKLDGVVTPPKKMHPKRPIEGFACTRSEVSGKRLWGAFAKRFPDPRGFFERALVINYCPLLFLDEGGANVTPDKIKGPERAALEAVCDAHLRRLLDVLAPKHVLGVGHYAAKRIANVLGHEVPCLPHPSPASPAANRGWEDLARRALEDAGVSGLL